MAEPHDQLTLDVLESLGRVVAGLTATQDLETVLTNLVTAVADHTSWQLCWIIAADLERGTIRVIARRDRLNYTESSSAESWDLEIAPAFEAIARNEAIEIVDAQNADEFPVYRDEARLRGFRCGLVQPLGVADRDGNPMVLYVQSSEALLPSAVQRLFIKVVAQLAAVAVRLSVQLAVQRRQLMEVGQANSAQLQVLGWVLSGISVGESLDRIQDVSSHSISVFLAGGTQIFVGRSPAPQVIDQARWEEISAEVLSPLLNPGGLNGADEWKLLSTEAGNLEALPLAIGADGRKLGTVVLIRQVGVPMKADWLTSPVSVATFALLLLRDHFKYERVEESRLVVLRQLISGDWTERTDMLARADFVGFGSNPVALAIVEELDENAAPDDVVYKAALRAVGRWRRAQVIRIDNTLVLLLPGDRSSTEAASKIRTVADEILSYVSRGLVIAYGGVCQTLEDFPNCWREARQGARLGRYLGRPGFVGREEFGVYRLLFAAAEDSDIEKFLTSTLGNLLVYDREHGSQLVETAEAFAVTGGKYQEAARRLHVHVSTLRYRLERIEELMGRPWSDEVRFELGLATRILRLRAESESRMAQLTRST